MISLLLYIFLEASRLGIDPQVAMCVCSQESKFNVQAVGDQGKAVGAWQWHLASWEQIRNEMDLPTCDLRRDASESTRTALWAMANGYEHWWSSYEHCAKEGP